MEKRRNTLDRWQRLRFGRRAASNPPEDKIASADAEAAAKRSSDKTERLRELTELLKGARNLTNTDTKTDPVPPPVPPPRKPRQPSSNNSSSIEKFIDTSASESGSPVSATKMDHSNLSSENIAEATAACSAENMEMPLIDTLRPNKSVSNIETIIYQRKIKENKNKNKDAKLPLAEDNSLFKVPVSASSVASSPTTSLPRAESRTIVGAYTQKTIPFRSASFSQVDYSSGKYIRSALGALKASLTKSKQLAIVDNTNLTLPRKKDKSRNTSPSTSTSTDIVIDPPPPPPLPPYDIWIPLKPQSDKSTRNELNLNLLGSSSNVIMEEDNENSPTADSKESKYLVPKSKDLTPFKLRQASQMIIDSLSEEEIAMHSPDDFFQTATTCLIPVPVYECAVRDWVDSHLADQWINACEMDSAKIIEKINVDAQNLTNLNANSEIPEFFLLQDTVEKKQDRIELLSPNICIQEVESPVEFHLGDPKEDNTNNIPYLPKIQSPTLDLDDLPSIAVTPGSSISGSFDEVENQTITENDKSKSDSTQDPNTDFLVEVRKRNSNDETRNSDNTQSTSGSGTSSPKSNIEEKRRIDKSKRRKGIYIQWAALDKHNKELSTVPWGEDSSQENTGNILSGIDVGQPIWPTNYDTDKNRSKEGNSSIESESDVEFRNCDLIDAEKLQQNKSGCLSCGSPEECQTSGSQGQTTPDSEYNRPLWPKTIENTKIRRQSLSLQSSEDKDESPATASPPTKPHHNKTFVLRSDSISDNELSDRTPPSRDRASQSPAPGEQDLKRYSKRPLRGPYGQMLEAEMKKPAKQNYDGLLEELNRSER